MYPKRHLKELLSKIILFYSAFYVILKLIAILFREAWAVPNLIIALPFVIFAVVGGMMLKQNRFSWIYVITGIVVISAIRYYEAQWVVDLHEYLN